MSRVNISLAKQLARSRAKTRRGACHIVSGCIPLLKTGGPEMAFGVTNPENPKLSFKINYLRVFSRIC
ncbi:hypothetical protein, partial [Rhizobium nepotum]|uniref:hypothetical protein n=1 Tax=Rhizobium nepotum TaxID=1035271 RepID=UPI001AEBCFA4